MPEVKLSAPGHAAMGKLYDVLAIEDDAVPKSEVNCSSWCDPGISIDPSGLKFRTYGLTGGVNKRDVAELSQPAGPGTAGGRARRHRAVPVRSPSLVGTGSQLRVGWM